MPDEVLNKIKYLCKNINKVEWSGILFYSIDGSITKPEELKITLQDILPMDMGNASATSYDIDERYMNYIMEDESRMEWIMGHIHSHHTMRVFFSGVDMSEINDNSEAHNFYLSLIVNNYMDFDAKIAFRAKAETVTKDIPYHALDENGDQYVISTATFNVSKEKMFTYDCEVMSKAEQVVVSSPFADQVTEIMKPKPVKTYRPAHKTTKKHNTHTSTKKHNPNYKGVVHDRMNNTKHNGKQQPFDAFMKDFPFADNIHPNLIEDHTEIEILAMSLLNFTNALGQEDTIDTLFEFIDEMEITDIELSSTVLNTLPNMFERFFPHYDHEGTMFISVTEQILEVFEQHVITYPIINTTIEQIRAMLTKFEDYGARAV